eukprot:UN14456
MTETWGSEYNHMDKYRTTSRKRPADETYFSRDRKRSRRKEREQHTSYNEYFPTTNNNSASDDTSAHTHDNR